MVLKSTIYSLNDSCKTVSPQREYRGRPCTVQAFANPASYIVSEVKGTEVQPSAHTLSQANNARLLATPGSVAELPGQLLLYMQASYISIIICVVWGKGGPAICHFRIKLTEEKYGENSNRSSGITKIIIRLVFEQYTSMHFTRCGDIAHVYLC